MALSLLTLFLSMASVQFGASLAKGLFPFLGAMGATSWRLFLAAILLLIVWRPWRERLKKNEWVSVTRYGLALGVMNLSFYLALERIPLGIAVALEFSGPLSVALFTSRKARDFIWAILAAFGLGQLIPWQTGATLDPVGVFFALCAGGAWAAYIIFGQKAGQQLHGGKAVALGMIVAALFAIPFGVVDRGISLWQPEVMVLAFLVAIFSSALPYSLEMMALKRLEANTFSILMSLEPAVATLMGFVFLKEKLGPKELMAIFCIVTASFGSSFFAKTKAPIPNPD